MKLIKPSFEIIEQAPGIEGIMQHIEKCGRTCYKSEDKITENSAKKFVDMIINRGHTAMIEHGTVYLKLNLVFDYDLLGKRIIINRDYLKYETNPYSETRYVPDGDSWTPTGTGYITTNYRVLLQNDWLDDLKYQCEPTEHHVKRITVKFVCDRGVSHEFVRHRVFSFAQESTRYCNYSKNKFDSECTFIIPCWADSLALQEAGERSLITSDDYGELFTEYYYKLNRNEAAWFKPWDITPEANFVTSLLVSEQIYLELLNQGWKPQQARAVLPNSLKTELIMTGTIEQWEGFFKLRDANDAHPQARELVEPLHEEFIKRGYLK